MISVAKKKKTEIKLQDRLKKTGKKLEIPRKIVVKVTVVAEKKKKNIVEEKAMQNYREATGNRKKSKTLD